MRNARLLRLRHIVPTLDDLCGKLVDLLQQQRVWRLDGQIGAFLAQSLVVCDAQEEGHEPTQSASVMVPGTTKRLLTVP